MRHSSGAALGNRLAILSRVFSPLVMDRLVLQRESRYLNEILSNVDLPEQIDTAGTVACFLSTLYSRLLAEYRCEYVYKNEIASKILMGRHSLSTAQLLTEVRVGKSKADVVIINGTSTAYEIKSAYDSMARLTAQLQSYSRVFEYVNVVTAPCQVAQVMDLAQPHVGVLVLTGRQTLSVQRAASSNIASVDVECLFDLMRKPEYTRVIESYFGQVPSVPNGRFHAACKEMFVQIPAAHAHHQTMTALSGRFSGDGVAKYASAFPKAMRAYACSISSDERRLQSLADLLSTPMSLVTG